MMFEQVFHFQKARELLEKKEKIVLTKNVLANFTAAWNFLQDECDGALDQINETVVWWRDKYLRIDFSSSLEKYWFDELKKKLKKRFDKVKFNITEKEEDLGITWFYFDGSVFIKLEKLWEDSL